MQGFNIGEWFRVYKKRTECAGMMKSNGESFGKSYGTLCGVEVWDICRHVKSTAGTEHGSCCRL